MTLTDYHTHLRPDRVSVDPAEAFGDENIGRYLAVAREEGIGEFGVSEHIYRFREGLQLCSDEFWRAQGKDDLAYYAELIASSPARLGIEVDFIPGREEETGDLLDQFPFDYVIGSVHTLGGQPIDTEDNPVWQHKSIEAVWEEYFLVLAEAIQTGLFDIFAHPDLVKVKGLVPGGDLTRFYAPALEAIAEKKPVLEVSTAGLRKKAGEIYPSPLFLELAHEAGARFALSSDAHQANHVGYAYDEALALMKQTGIREIAAFAGREERSVPLAA